MEPVRLALIGAGAWARAAHLPSLAGSADAVWTAVAATTEASARRAAEPWSIPLATGDWRAAVGAPGVEGVVLACPPSLRREVALAALGAGKHVLCELPLAHDAGTARELVAAARAAGRVGAYARPRPWLYGGDEARRLLQEGALGELAAGHLRWRGNPWLRADPRESWRARADAGPAVIAGVALAVLGGLAGAPVEVAGVLRRTGPADPQGPAPAPDDLVARVRTRGGAELAIDAGFAAAEDPENGVTLRGERGALRWEWSAPPRLWVARDGGPWEAEPYELASDLGRAYPYVRRFARAIRTGERPDPDFASGADELAALEALLESTRRGGAPVAVRR